MRSALCLLSLSFLAIPAFAQDDPTCSQNAAKASACCAEAPAKALAALTAEIKALPAERRAELSEAAQTLVQHCPVAQGATQVVTVLGRAAEAVGADCCAALPAGGHGGDAAAGETDGEAGVKALTETLAAHWALLAELGVSERPPACCAAKGGAGADDEEDDEGAEGDDEEGEGDDEDEAECCADMDQATKFAVCAQMTTAAMRAIPEQIKALDAPTHAKIAKAGEVLAQAKILPAMQAALGYYAQSLGALSEVMADTVASGEAAAEGGCPGAEGMVSRAQPMAKVTAELAAMTKAFLDVAGAANGGECCEGGAAQGCCAEGEEKAPAKSLK